MKRLVLFILVCLCVPARAETTYTYDMKSGLAPWISWMPVEKTANGVRMTLPGKLDINHLDGIGPLWLLAHLPTEGVGVRNSSISIRPRSAFDFARRISISRARGRLVGHAPASEGGGRPRL